MTAHGTPVVFRLWPFPLFAGLLPVLAVLVAFNLAVAQGQFPACNPLVDGCVSISRAARHDLPNVLFKALLLPAAPLQAIVWLQTAAWLQHLGAARDRWLKLLPWIGITAAVFLVLYAAFLGTEGTGYRLMRRYGVFVYFGFTCIAMLIVGGAVHRVAAATGQLRRAGAALHALVAALPVLGIVNSMAPLYVPDEHAQDVLGNLTEWWGGVVFTAFFMLLAWLWRRTNFTAALGGPGR